MSVLNAPIRFSRDHDPQALECPRCRGEWFYLHHDRVESFERGEDAKCVNKTTITGKMTAVDHVPNGGSGNPSPRRHGLRIHFWCEACGDGLILNLLQHKGATILEWSIEPTSQEWLERERSIQRMIESVT
jgi:hypothetical protein